MFKRPAYLMACISLSAISGFSQGVFVPAQDKHISYEGRVIVADGSAQLIWPGTSVRINFQGTGIAAQLKDQDTANYYIAIIDGAKTAVVHTDTSKKIYALASNLAYGKHTVQLFKRTEWDKGKTWFYGFAFDSKTKLLEPSKPPKRKIEFYGNSITCGYSVFDTTGDSPTGFYESNYDAYAAITARHYNAQYYCIAKSGIGILVSWFPLIMPEMYNRVDPRDSTSLWNFSNYTPDVVVINLFQNDSWIIKLPKNAQFKNRFGTTAPTESQIITAYKNFVQTIRNTYPHAQIICMLGSMDITEKGSPWPGYVQKAVEQLNDKKVYTYIAPFKGTPGHPKIAEQQKLADGLIQFIDEHVKW